MSINLYDTTIPLVRTMLSNLSFVLTKGEQHADANKIPHKDFLEARLIEDMLPLTKQIQIACDVSKFIMVRVLGAENQPFDDNETTFAELQERIASTLKILDKVKREDFDAPEVLTQTIELRGRTFQGGVEYVNRYAFPNFFFHVVTAYDILRSKGVQIGKLDFLLGEKNVPSQ